MKLGKCNCIDCFSGSQVMRHENSSILELDGKEVSEFTPSKPREKWIRKRTHVKIRVRRAPRHLWNLRLLLNTLRECCWRKDVFVSKNVTANHRVNDAVFTEDGNQVVTGRFMYGPLDMVTLTGEKVSDLWTSVRVDPREKWVRPP